MNVVFFFVVAVLVLGVATIPQATSAQYYDKTDSSKAVKKDQEKKPLKISSPVFKDFGIIPKKFTCDGKDVSPPLKFTNIPQKTKSLALIVDDPDAPAGTFTHWIVWGISPKKTQFAVGERKGITEGTTDFGKTGYGGPCPPSGSHRYFFKLYALDSKIDLSTKSKKKELEAAIQDHIIQSATLVGKYSRS
jgi:hypothetical protein